MRCGKDCLKNKDCNTFNFASTTCSLMNTAKPNPLNIFQSSICGLIPDRMPKPTCQWQTSEDDSYQWTDSCKIQYFAGCSPQQVGLLSPCNSTRTCAEACLAQPSCNYFYYRNQGSYYDCLLEKCTILTGEAENKAYGVNSGFIVARKYNVESIPNYCDLK